MRSSIAVYASLVCAASALSFDCEGPSTASEQDGGTDGGADGATISVDSGPLVEQCQALAMTFASNCYNEYTGDALTPDTERVCIWQAYARLCQTGRTQLLLDSMMCFGQNPHCWTFSDPNDVATCLDGVHAASPPSPALVSLGQQLCAACDAGGGCATDAGAWIGGGTAEVFPYFSDKQIGQVTSCLVGTSCTNAAFATACPSVSELGIFSCR